MGRLDGLVCAKMVELKTKYHRDRNKMYYFYYGNPYSYYTKLCTLYATSCHSRSRSRSRVLSSFVRSFVCGFDVLRRSSSVPTDCCSKYPPRVAEHTLQCSSTESNLKWGEKKEKKGMQLLRGTHNPFHFGATDRILVELCVDTSKFSGFVFVRNRIRGNDANLCNVKDAPSDIEALC